MKSNLHSTRSKMTKEQILGRTLSLGHFKFLRSTVLRRYDKKIKCLHFFLPMTSHQTGQLSSAVIGEISIDRRNFVILTYAHIYSRGFETAQALDSPGKLIADNILRPVVDVVKISILQIVCATRHDTIGTNFLWNRITAIYSECI